MDDTIFEFSIELITQYLVYSIGDVFMKLAVKRNFDMIKTDLKDACLGHTLLNITSNKVR